MKLSRLNWFLPIFCLLFVSGLYGQIATGGTYSLDQSVIANGGGTSSGSGNTYKVEGTNGEIFGGTTSNNGSYNVRSGFWASETFITTAAGANIGGRVLDPNGNGLRGTYVTLSGGNLTLPRFALTNAFGYFTFENVEAGQVYLVGVRSKRYGFSQPVQVITVFDNVSEIVFQAAWEN